MSDRFRYGLLHIDKAQQTAYASTMLEQPPPVRFELSPVLGSFTCNPDIAKEICLGGRNSTRWIINVLQRPGIAKDTKFWLMRNNQIFKPGMFSFSFSPFTHGFYDARPILRYSEEHWFFTICATPVEKPAEYQLSIDVMHSMYR